MTEYIASHLVDKVVSLVAKEVSLAWGVRNELQKLQKVLISIRTVIAAAEQRQSNDYKLQIWLEDLKDIMYDSEDVLDEFECEALQMQVIKQGNLIGRIAHFFSHSNPLAFRLKMGHNIKKIRLRLDQITFEKDAFNLNQQSIFDKASHSLWRETHSQVNISEVIGRDLDRNEIVQCLLHPNAYKNPFVISIVGIGGIGKTTLAKLVYNDDRVKLNFDLKIWVCVSEEFDIKQILQKIIKLAVHDNVNFTHSTIIQSIHLQEVEQLQAKLQVLLKNKKFLLVLDDMWSENRLEWYELRDLLTVGIKGSSIIVTTRSSKVASTVGTCYEHKLEGLSHDNCMLLFRKLFEDGHVRVTNSKLLEIMSQIVDKCRGVPLVVKALGGMLHSNIDERYWRSIRDKDILTVLQKEDDILPIIKLSYDHLPPHLKRCFAFCSLFPKDFEFNNINMYSCWTAAGLISTSDDNEKSEEVCDHYIKELLARSFFQDFEEYGSIFGFKMHDLVHDLALSVARNEFSVAKFDTPNISCRVRHISFSNSLNNQPLHVPPFFRQAKRLKTLISFCHNTRMSREVLKACISNCKYLRILDLSGSTFEVMSDNIDNLRHLRLLDLSGNLKIKRLPESICNLQSLQFLYLAGCGSLEELPRNMWKLINLQHFSVTTKQKSLKSSGIQYLKSLCILWIKGCNNLESLFEEMDMRGLASLRLLTINECESLTSIPMGGLKCLNSLEVLIIHDCKRLDLSVEDEISLSLRTLSIGGLPNMWALPKWVQGAANTLQSLRIWDCQQLMELPKWLQKLSHLERLAIYACQNLLLLPNGVKNLTNLEHLEIYYCGGLSGRCRPNGLDWHKIAHIPKIEINGRKITNT